MEKIGDVICRILKKEDRSYEEKDYLALWEDVVPKETRRHARATVQNEKIFVWVDNPTAGHHLFLQREKITAEFQRRGMKIKEIIIKQARPNNPGGKNVSRFNRSNRHAV
ncbi:MAG: DciA family protein [Candidatus Omnitrophota bacterium]